MKPKTIKGKLSGSEVEYVSDTEEYMDGSDKQVFHAVQFVKTPRGRRKRLFELSETFDSELSEVDFTNLGRTAQERYRVVEFFLERTNPRIDTKTRRILRTPHLAVAESFFVRFEG
jgi:hypothetical protein